MKNVYAKNKNGKRLAFRTPESLVYISSTVTLSDKLTEFETALDSIIASISAINTQLDKIEKSL